MNLPDSNAPGERKLTAVMFVDIVGYTSQMQKNEALALELLNDHRRLVRSVLQRHQGQEIKTIGDAFLLVFASAVAAAKCALEIQQRHKERNLKAPQERQISLRIGIHVGEVIHGDGDVLGDGVNITSRICACSRPGSICISSDMEHQIRNKVEARLIKLGPTELKNMQEPMEIWCLLLPGEEFPHTDGRMKVVYSADSGLSELDSFLLMRICQIVLEKQDCRFRLFSNDLWEQLKLDPNRKEDFFDSLEILNNRGFIRGESGFRSPGIGDFYVSHLALDDFLKNSFEGYDSLIEKIIFEIVENGARKSSDIAAKFNCPEIIVTHILAVFEGKGHLKLTRMFGGGCLITKISAELKRSVRRQT